MHRIARLRAIHRVEAPNPVLRGNPVREIAFHQPVQHSIQRHPVHIQAPLFDGFLDLLVRKRHCTAKQDFQHGNACRSQAAVGCPQQ